MEEYEERICGFKKYVKQALDLMVDSYKWKVMADECDDAEISNKYRSVSDTLYNLFMQEHNHIGQMFKQ